MKNSSFLNYSGPVSIIGSVQKSMDNEQLALSKASSRTFQLEIRG